MRSILYIGMIIGFIGCISAIKVNEFSFKDQIFVTESGDTIKSVYYVPNEKHKYSLKEKFVNKKSNPVGLYISFGYGFDSDSAVVLLNKDTVFSQVITLDESISQASSLERNMITSSDTLFVGINSKTKFAIQSRDMYPIVSINKYESVNNKYYIIYDHEFHNLE